ncbi:hypothetical protein FA95DRAFT_333315 [Auriscalpium vulgare]|uniref:Uncharacterized protein n=1 Tax=Auriscalpium vulgare TaxID=40419 RepID=A0ACB8RI75_9AGAM|nr:hypothetical protein FA95DRAFT_333315 [Auriscalpium vulgare]
MLRAPQSERSDVLDPAAIWAYCALCDAALDYAACLDPASRRLRAACLNMALMGIEFKRWQEDAGEEDAMSSSDVSMGFDDDCCSDDDDLGSSTVVVAVFELEFRLLNSFW